MSYFLRELAHDESSTPSTSCPQSGDVSERYAHLLKKFHTTNGKTECLRIPAACGVELENAENYGPEDKFSQVAYDIRNAINVVGAPSSFATVAIAKTILAKYGTLLANEEDVEKDVDADANALSEKNDEQSGKADQLVSAGLTCVFDVLRQLSRKDPELCVQALNSLLSLIQNMAVDSLRNEFKPSISSMMSVLKYLRENGSATVCSRASSCLAALAVASGQPEQLVQAVQSLVCMQRLPSTSSDSSYDLIQIPENLHQLNLKVQQSIYQRNETSQTWSARPLDDRRIFCSFDLPMLPDDSITDSPDEDHRLYGAVACDGNYAYVLNNIGLCKLGTGLQETILGKLYASNQELKATKNCLLTFCNGSLYLRRGQSSCIAVIDTDSLREIGEIVLPTESIQTALFSDGTCFYHATLNAHSVLALTPLNDSFAASNETKCRRIRLTDVSFCTFGESKPIPHHLPLKLPSNLHNQAVDLHLGREVAFLQARTGKVYYAGNGTKYGLQETGSTWMELILPETVVQLSVGSEQVLFRSGNGHIWITGGEERRRAGKLRRLATANRRKAISLCCSGAAYAYVSENGKVFLGGRHSMRTQPETGQVQGLEGVHMVSVCLGKTHAVAISRHGHLYTWGMNNLNQCGHSESAPSTSHQSPAKSRKGSFVACAPSEHIWVKDVASLCIQCGECSARGASCAARACRVGTPPSGALCPCGAGESVCLRCGLCRNCGEAGVGTSNLRRTEQVTPTRTILSPARVTITKGTQDIKVSSVCCGNFHTILLSAGGRVFSFGSNCHGQLGVTDFKSYQEPQMVVLPPDVQVTQIAAGANHSVLRTADGSVYTFGAHKNGQLARPVSDCETWNARPGRVPGFGPGYPAFASWVGAVGDATLIHSHTSLLTHDDVVNSQVVANKNDLFIFPQNAGKDYISIRRKTSTFAHYQLGPSGLYTSWCLEQRYDLLWCYNAAEMRLVAFANFPRQEIESKDELADVSFLRCPELAVPLDSPAHLSSIQLGISLLSCTYAAFSMNNSSFWSNKSLSNLPNNLEAASNEGYNVVCRFEGNGGGWGYSAHSVEAIQFRPSKDVKLLGIGLYGGRGEYVAKLKIFRLLGAEEDELYVEHVTETDETLFECAQHETAALMFSQPVVVKANQWHVISAKITGPSSDCGAAGRHIVSCDEVTFSFRNSVISNNGTDVNVGQIPELYYQLIDAQNAGETLNENTKSKTLTSFSRLFSSSSLSTVTPQVLASLIEILEWSLLRVLEQTGEGDDKTWATERAAVVALMAMRVLARNILLVYLKNEVVDEPSQEYANQMKRLHSLIVLLFQSSTEWIDAQSDAHRIILSEATRLFVSSSHCFLSSKQLLCAHLATVMTNPTAFALTNAVVDSIAQRQTALNMFFGDSRREQFPQLSTLILQHFEMDKEQVDTLITFPNFLRFLYEKSFDSAEGLRSEIAKKSQEIVVNLSKELSIPDVRSAIGPTLLHTPSRFRRRSAVSTWELSENAADAIAIKVDCENVQLHGIGLYLSAEGIKRVWKYEILLQRFDALDQWELLQTGRGDTAGSTRDNDVIKLASPVSLQSGAVYAIKITSPDGGKTYCGDGGSSHVRLSNGSKMSFSPCSHSENGTSVQRGQIPFLIYSIQEKTVKTNFQDNDQIYKSLLLLLRLLSNKIGTFVTNGELPDCARTLMSRISGHLMIFMQLHPDKAIEMMATLEQLIPMVSSLNGALKASTLSESFEQSSDVCESKAQQHTVESTHPYKANNMQSSVVGFDHSVEYMCVQFNPACETAQADDTLTIYLAVERDVYVPVVKCFGSRDWPASPILLPGNALWFVLESSMEIEGVSADQMYGYHCTVTGYRTTGRNSNLRLEQELVWLSASACRIASQLPADPSALALMSVTEDDARGLLEKHGGLLKKGINIGHHPTLNEIIQEGIPPPAQSSDHVFLREFIASCPSTTAGQLARWLPTGPVVDVTKCQLTLQQGDMFVGKAVQMRLTTRDQWDRPVCCASIVAEVIVGIGTSNSVLQNIDSSQLPPLQLIQQNPYQPAIFNRARYTSISAMTAFANYSHEELRLAYMKQEVMKENVQLKHKNNSTFIGRWIPQHSGVYRVECKIDGFQLSHSYTVRVSERDCSIDELRAKREQRVAQLSRARLATINPLSEFQGVRMRTNTSLTAPTVGVIPRGGTVSYIEEVENDDGRWLRLTDETAALYGYTNGGGQVWCLSYQNCLRRELIPLDGEMRDENRVARRNEFGANIPTSNSGLQKSVIIETNEIYIVETGETLSLYSAPAQEHILQEQIEGRAEVASDGWIHNHYGVWIRVAATHKYLLVENSVGRSSIHSQSFSANGNEDEEMSPPPRQHTGALCSALRPSVVDCSRHVFAAFLWHEHLVKDAMAAAAYLKFNQHLHTMWCNSGDGGVAASAPAALQPMVRLWKDVFTAVQMSVDQHLIMPPAVGRALSISKKKDSKSCELCEDSFKVPVTVHMRMAHPGCGEDSQGYGYNSGGKFTSGWSGECGNGGRSTSAWYLLCQKCRTKYLRQTPAGHRQERNRRWREFRLSTTTFDARPEVIIKQNALFLLDLNASLECDSKSSSTSTTSGWAINLFPTQNSSPSTVYGTKGKLNCSFAKSSFMSLSMSRAGHSSDPGPKVALTSPPTVNPTSSLGTHYRGQHHSINENNDSAEVLQSPSAALRTLLSHSTPSTTEMLKRPVLAFVVEHHNLKRIRLACEQSVRRAVAFSHAFRVWNWLLRLVSSETSVSDVIFQYLSSISSYLRLGEFIFTADMEPHVKVLPHPWRLCFLAGPVAARMVQHLHAFLYTIAVILQSGGVDSRLRSLCFKAWTMQLTQHEQELLILTCNILASVGNVLSDPAESSTLGHISSISTAESCDSSLPKSAVGVKEMRDVTLHAKIEASSRQAMVVCLTDGSTETFWESGDEDKNRGKTLNVMCDSQVTPIIVGLFIDNVRDDAYRVSSVNVRVALNDGSRKELYSKNVEQNFCGWIKCCVAGMTHAQISLKGPHNSVRIRQVLLLGFSTLGSPESEAMKPSTSHQLFFNNTQNDAFGLFQAIASQAFTENLSEESNGALRERVVDLLFSRVQLQPLQDYVSSQAVNALQREVELLCNQGKRNYSYACGLQAILLRICETRKGTDLFALRNNVLVSASELLIFAPQIVQMQALHTIERIISLFRPDANDLPRFLRNMLIVIAKVITLQVRDKATHTVTTATFNGNVAKAPTTWRIDRVVAPEIGKLTAQLITNICSGHFSPEWQSVLRSELASCLLGVVQMTSSTNFSSRDSMLNAEAAPLQGMLASKRFWISVAALALIREKEWLTSTSVWSEIQSDKEPDTVTFCENHDDGHTTAQVFCTVCEMTLCRECFTIMHLHKKNRSHQVQQVGSGDRANGIDVHQGCSRMRINNILVLFHGETLNGLVELSADPFNLPLMSDSLRSSTTPLSTIVTRCRFCGNVVDVTKQMYPGVCSHEECMALAPTACEQTLACGHPCGGIAKESACLPCLVCHSDESAQDGDDVCVVCFTDRLRGAPCIRLGCGHLFHFHCIRRILERRWNGPRIMFRFIRCPLCNQQIEHAGLSDLLEPILALRDDVVTKAKMRLEYDGLLNCTALTDPNSEFYNRPEEYALDRYMYVLCSKCNKAYFGGENRCQLALDSSQYNPSELICGGCSDTTGAQVCGRHGVEYLEYKCRFCCSIAVYFCFGTTHFCAACHDDFQRLMCIPKTQLPKCPAGPRGVQLDEGPCPLQIEHPPAGEEFAMGCGICRNLHTF